MKYLIILLLLLIVGCVHVQTEGYSYTRLGDQKLDGLYIEKDPNGLIIELNKQESMTDILNAFQAAGLLIKP